MMYYMYVLIIQKISEEKIFELQELGFYRDEDTGYVNYTHLKEGA